MKFVFHGGAREVGKSCIELLTQENRYILDAGLKFKEDGFEAPFEVLNLPKIDGLFLSHAHLDHTGAIPLFEHANLLCPIFATAQTRDLVTILLKDSYRIGRIRHLHPAYEKLDLKKAYNATRVITFDKEYTFQNIRFKFLNAGHIPGSAMILIWADGKKILYTGDYKLKSTQLMRGMEKDLDRYISTGDLKDIDVLITESTYGGKPMPDRPLIEQQFMDQIAEVIKKGTVLVPVFALGRAQDVLLLLSKRKWPCPIYYDGLSVKMTKSILKNDPTNLNEIKTLREMFRRATLITKETQRHNIMNNRAIVITTSGMLQGGPILEYLENMWGNPNNAVYMTGYQCKRTNGRTLLEEKYIYLKGWKTYVKCQVQKFSFSGHADDLELKEFITKVNPKNLIIQHGDEEGALALREWAQKYTKARVFVPSVGDALEF